MKTIDNREQILNMISNDFANDPNCVFFVQCLQRKKDGNENDNKPVFQYSIDRVDKAERIINRAVAIAEEKNARVYVSIAPKDKASCLLRLAQSCIDATLNKDGLNKSFESIMYGALARHTVSSNPRVLFDFDVSLDSEEGVMMVEFFDMIFNTIEDLKDKKHYVFETPNGFHIVCDSYGYVCDEVVNLITKKEKEFLIKNFASNRHKTIEDAKKANTKQLFSSILHKESAGTVVYYKHN